jgi:hypothetical protein
MWLWDPCMWLYHLQVRQAAHQSSALCVCLSELSCSMYKTHTEWTHKAKSFITVAIFRKTDQLYTWSILTNTQCSCITWGLTPVPWLTHYSLVPHTGVQVQSPLSQCERCGVQSGTETGFSPITSVFPITVIPLMLYSFSHLPVTLHNLSSWYQHLFHQLVITFWHWYSDNLSNLAWV